MPLFVTVTPGTTITSSTTLTPSTLNLLGTPSINVTGSVDGGTLSVESELGAGATFTMELPLAAPVGSEPG